MKCPNCGKQIPDAARVCGYCGSKLIEVERKEEAAKPVKNDHPGPKKALQPDPSELDVEKKKRIWPWLVGLGIPAVLVVVLILLFSHPRVEPILPNSTTPNASDVKSPSPSITATLSQDNQLLEDEAFFTEFLRGKVVNPQVKLYEDFENWQTYEWYFSSEASIVEEASAIFKIPGVEGLKAYLCSQEYNQNRALLTKFKLTGQTYEMEFFVSQNKWATPEYMRFGGAIYNTNQLETSIWEGTNNDLSSIFMDGTLRYESNRWYGLFIGQDSNGNFLISSWALDNPDGEYVAYSMKKTGAWTSGPWHSCFQIGQGTLYVDDFLILSLDEINL